MNKVDIIQQLDREIDRLREARRILDGSDRDGVRSNVATNHQHRSPRHMSADARARIAAAQKKRWAKVKSAQQTSAPTPINIKAGKRRLSAEARARIATAQRKRWAKRRKAA